MLNLLERIKTMKYINLLQMVNDEKKGMISFKNVVPKLPEKVETKEFTLLPNFNVGTGQLRYLEVPFFLMIIRR